RTQFIYDPAAIQTTAPGGAVKVPVRIANECAVGWTPAIPASCERVDYCFRLSGHADCPQGNSEEKGKYSPDKQTGVFYDSYSCWILFPVGNRSQTGPRAYHGAVMRAMMRKRRNLSIAVRKRVSEPAFGSRDPCGLNAIACAQLADGLGKVVAYGSI